MYSLYAAFANDLVQNVWLGLLTIVVGGLYAKSRRPHR